MVLGVWLKEKIEMFYKHDNGFVRLNTKFVKWTDRFNPLNLPPNIVRVRTRDGKVPKNTYGATYETATLVPGKSDVYDVYKSGTSFRGMFDDSINVVEVLGANTTDITDMDSMFYGCTSLSSVPLFDTSSVTNMTYMFYNCPSLTNIPFFDTTNVTDMSHMFASCASLTNIPLFNTSKVTTMYWMFGSCTSLSTVPLFDTSKVTNMESMFQGCTSLITVLLFDTTNVTNMKNMFWNCTSVESGALSLYQQASSQANPPSNHLRTFRSCGSNTTTGAAELAQIPSDWK